jgi:hypothetical protein
MSLKWPPKDKDETLDYSLDWSRALESGETISTVTWSIVNSSDAKVDFGVGITVDSLKNLTQTNTSSVSTIYLQAGLDNQEYQLYCSILTSAARVKERTVKIRIREYN